MMAIETIVPTDRELKVIDLSSSETQDLIREAEANDAADRALTVFEALKKYKKAVFWAMFLSTSLIMEGYDVVIVSRPSWSIERSLIFLFSDNFVLRPDPISREIWCNGWHNRKEADPASMAVWSVKLCPRWSVGWSDYQRVLSGSLWLSKNHDVLHGMDGCCHLHRLLCTVAVGLGLWRIDVRNTLGCFPGMHMKKFLPLPTRI